MIRESGTVASIKKIKVVSMNDLRVIAKVSDLEGKKWLVTFDNTLRFGWKIVGLSIMDTKKKNAG